MSLPYKNYIFDLYGTLADIRTDERRRELWVKTALYYTENGAPQLRGASICASAGPSRSGTATRSTRSSCGRSSARSMRQRAPRPTGGAWRRRPCFSACSR